MFNTKEFADTITTAVKSHLSSALSPVLERLSRLEAKGAEKGLDGVGIKSSLIDKDGNLVITKTDGEVMSLGFVVGTSGKDGKDGIDGEKGKTGPQGDAGEAGPQGETGPQGEKGDVGEKGDTGERGETGEKGDAGDIGETGPQGEKGDTGERGKSGEKGADGVGIQDLHVNKDSELVVLLTDGAKKNLGDIRGAKGDAGEKGADGFGFDDLSFEHKGDREFSFKFEKDGRTKNFSFSIPVAIYRGVYDADKSYARGDMVTRGGSIWHCEVDDTKSAPSTNDDWALSVKAGRNGKDGTDGIEGKQGIQGPRGISYGGA